jgi:hypothetical protein
VHVGREDPLPLVPVVSHQFAACEAAAAAVLRAARLQPRTQPLTHHHPLPLPPEGAGGPQLLCLTSKRTALFAPLGGTLIARSDTNGEDLEGFAGAGLYDSVAAVDLHEAPVDLAAEPLMWDAGLQQQVRGGEGLRPYMGAGGAVWAAAGGQGRPGWWAARVESTAGCVCGGGMHWTCASATR